MDHLGFDHSTVEMYDPAVERVLLKQAVLPTLATRPIGIHPAVNTMLMALTDQMLVPQLRIRRARIFAARGQFQNPQSSRRICLNEDRVIELAASRSFAPVYFETLTWPEQIAMFRDATSIIGPFGSAMHNALFAMPETRIGTIGWLSDVQSKIGALRGQSNAYFADGLDSTKDFTVGEAEFAEFLDMCCG